VQEGRRKGQLIVRPGPRWCGLERQIKPVSTDRLDRVGLSYVT
jgi:hypothetical protein